MKNGYLFLYFFLYQTKMSNPDCLLTTGPCYDADIRKKYKRRVNGKISTDAYMAIREGYADGTYKKGKDFRKVTFCWIDYCPSCQKFCEEKFLPNNLGTVSWQSDAPNVAAGFMGVAQINPGETKFDTIERIRLTYQHAKIGVDDAFSFFHRSVAPKYSKFNHYDAVM